MPTLRFYFRNFLHLSDRCVNSKVKRKLKRPVLLEPSVSWMTSPLAPLQGPVPPSTTRQVVTPPSRPSLFKAFSSLYHWLRSNCSGSR